MTEEPNPQPHTASCAIPLIALGIAAALLIIAIPITKNLVGAPLRALEREAAPIAIEYIQKSTNNQATNHADPTKFNEPEFKSKLIKVIGTYKSSRITNLGTEKTTPPIIYVTLNVDGDTGNGIATIALQKQEGRYRIVNAGVYPR